MKMPVIVTLSYFLVLFTSSSIFSQNKPFPQQVDFTGCIKPNVDQAVMNSDVTSCYDSWKGSYLREAINTSGGYYIESGGTGGGGPKCTVSEAHGWGMIIFALMEGHDTDAQKYYDGMFKFFKDHPSSENKTSLMSWMVQEDEGDSASSSATDGDFDMAYSLILAHDQWGSDGDINYLQEARKMIINGLKVSDINPDIDRITLGDFVDNDDPTSEFYWSTRPSDWMGDHLRVFQFVTDEAVWTKIADNMYPIYNTFTEKYSPTAGLVSDFIVKETIEPAPEQYLWEYQHTDCYYYNACRFPWRIAMDYVHCGTVESKNVCNKMLNWLKGATNNNPGAISAGYELDGTGMGGTGDLAFTAPFVAACIVDEAHQSYLNDGWSEISKKSPRGVYQHAINLLCMLVISGNWWKAEGEAPIPDTGGVIFETFKNEYYDVSLQTFLGAAYGYALHQEWSKIWEGGSEWWLYCDTSGTKFMVDEFEITPNNPGKMFKDGILHVEMITSTSTNAESYAGIGCEILLFDETNFFDFSNLTAINVRAKGTGTVRVTLNTKDIITFEDSTMRWGFYGTTMELESDWKTFPLDTVLFEPQQWSVAADSGWTWQDDGAKNAVNAIEISTSEPGKDIDLYIDSIVFIGLQYKRDFGFDFIPPHLTDVNFKPENNTMTSIFNVVSNAHKKAILLSYNLANSGNVRISIFDMKGKMVTEPVNCYQKKGSHTHLIDFNSNVISSGVYFVRFAADGNDISKRFSFLK